MRRSDFGFDSASAAEGSSVSLATPLSPVPTPPQTDAPLSPVEPRGGLSVLPGIPSLANGQGRLLILHSASFPTLHHRFRETQGSVSNGGGAASAPNIRGRRALAA